MTATQTPSGATPTPPGAAADARLPDMLVIGAMKASTTAFYELLTRHPGVWMPDVKEPHYFTARDYGERAALGRYAALFADAPEGVLLGEASTGYTKLPDLGPTPQRLRETLGEPRMIYLLRDPVDRLISNYRHSRLAGHYGPELGLMEAVACDPILVTASRYAQQVRAYHEEFGEDALLILTTNELHADPRGVMRRVEAFLGLTPLDEWPAKMPSSNSQQALAQSVAASRVAPAGIRSLARKVLPAAALGALKRLLPSAKPPAPVTPEEIDRLQTLIEDDLRDLVTLLGERIANWPSVRRMGGEA